MHTFEQRNAMIAYRRTFADMPVGDPMSGAAYGEYLKSKGVGMVIGVVAAVAAVWSGGASLGWWVGASGTTAVTATTLGGQLAAGAMMAGGVMSGVGIVTGNKNLTKIGGVLSLAGGLGSLLTAPSAGTSTMGTVANADKTAAAVQASAEMGSTATTGAVEAGSSAGATEKLMASLGSDRAALDVGTISGTEPVAQAASPAATATPTATPSTTAPADGLNVANNTYNGTPIQLPESGKGIIGQAFDGVSKFANDNKALIEIGSKAISGADKLSGAQGGEELQGAQATLANARAVTEGTVQAVNTAQADAVKAEGEAKARQRKNANTVIVNLDPINDPDYAAKKAAALERGQIVQDFVGPAAKGPVVANGLNWGSNIKAPNVTLPTPQARA